MRLRRVALFVAILLAGGLGAGWMASRVDRELREDLLGRARLVAEALNFKRIEALNGTADDLSRPAYQRLKEYLIEVRAADPGCRFLYIMGSREGLPDVGEPGHPDKIMFFYADSEPDDSEDYSPPGQIYDEASDEFRQVFTTRKAIVEGPIRDRWGTWVSALVPLSDPRTKRLIAVLGMDVDARNWRRDVAIRTALPITLTALALLVILVVGSILLERRTRHPRQAGVTGKWFSRLEAILAVMVGLVLTLFAAWLTQSDANWNQAISFRQQAASGTAMLAEVFRDLRDGDLESLARFYETDDNVTDREFQHFLEHLTRNQAVRAWEWVSAVPAGAREQFEQEARAAGRAGFEIWQRDTAGNRVPATGREMYYPVLQVAPQEGNENEIGFDLGSDPASLAAIDEAFRTGFTTATDPVTLDRETGSRADMQVFNPVYADAQHQIPRGLALAALRLEDVLAVAGTDAALLEDLLLIQPDGRSETLASTRDAGAPPSAKLVLNRPVMAFDKTFVVSATAGPEFLSAYPARSGYGVALVGLLLTAALAVVVSMAVRRREALEGLVLERTTALRASEEHLSATLHSIGDGVIACDTAGTVLSLNEAAEQLTGWTTAEAAGQSVEQVFPIVHAKTRETAENPIYRTLREGVGVSLAEHTALITRNGTERQISDSCAPIRGSSGEVTGAVLVFRDVTEEYRHREELQESEAFQRELLTNLTAGVVIVDPTTRRIDLVNEHAAALFGAPPDHLIGKSCHATLCPDPEGACLVCDLGSVVDHADSVMLRADGSPLPVIKTVKRVTLRGRKKLLECFVDISDRQRAEKALAEKEARLSAITNSAQDAVIMIDDAGAVRFWNPAAEKIFGYTDREILGKNFHDLVVPERFHEAHQPAFHQFRHTGQGNAIGKTLELEAIHKDGREFPVSLSLSAVLIDGQWNAIGLLRDITERKNAEKQLIETNHELELATARANEMAAQAELASAAKSEFLANMSHEIRTPMNGVIGMTSLLLDTPLSEEQGRCVDVIRSSGESLLAIINDILDFSKIEARKLDLESLNFDLVKLLDDFAATLALKAQDKGLELICAADPDVPALVKGDPGRLRQILTNLVGNAVKFTQKGEVAVRVSRVEREGNGNGKVEADANTCFLRFSVRDTGIGIPADKIGLLFHQFAQVDSSTTRKYGGTGLGLAISKQLAEMMGGAAGANSVEGEGSEFWFTARLDLQRNTVRETETLPAELAGLRVLIVDDNATNREILVRRLGSWGMRTEEAPNGRAGLEALRRAVIEKDPFHLAVVDMQMPEMDGETLGRAVRSDESLAGTRLVMLTSMGARGDAERAREAGFEAYVVKPIRHDELKGVLAHTLADGSGGKPRSIVTRHTVREALPSFAERKARILLAEDNVTNQKVALGFLKRLGLTADTVSNGREALDALDTRAYDLVFMDVQMPDMDGLEATRLIRHSSPATAYRSIPVIAMTAHTMQGDKDICIAAGMNDYVSKPISPQALAEALEKWLPAS